VRSGRWAGRGGREDDDRPELAPLEEDEPTAPTAASAAALELRRSSAARVAEQKLREVKRKHSATLEEPRENAGLYREAVSKLRQPLFFHFELELLFVPEDEAAAEFVFTTVLVRVVRIEESLPANQHESGFSFH